MSLDAALKLLEAVMRQPDRLAWKEYGRQSHVERKRRVVTSAKAAADIGKAPVDACWPDSRFGLAEHEGHRTGRLVW